MINIVKTLKASNETLTEQYGAKDQPSAIHSLARRARICKTLALSGRWQQERATNTSTKLQRVNQFAIR